MDSSKDEQSDNLVKYLIFGTVLIAFISYLQWHWNRRHLYQLAAKVHGPTAWPFIGSSYKFMGNTAFIYKSVMTIFADYDGWFRVWFGPHLVYGVSSPEDLEVVLNNPNSMHKMFLYKHLERMFGHGLFTAPVPTWKRHRKTIAPTFNHKILDMFVCVFAEQSEILVECLKKVAGKGEFDLNVYINRCTLDVICETAMGLKMNAQITEKTDLCDKIDRLAEIAFLRMFNMWYHFDFIFNMTSMRKEEDELLDALYSFTTNIVKLKREKFDKEQEGSAIRTSDEKPLKYKTFLDHLLQMTDKENRFTDIELRDEVNTFIITGSDTTASSLCFFLMVLGMHPEVQQKVYEEAMDVLGPDRLIEPEDLAHFPYTERVIKETLRLFPVGAFVVRDVYEDVKVNDKMTMSGGSSCILGIMRLHRNPDLWYDPLKFDPDRFLPENSRNRHPYTYIPFSGGPRNCIGMNYAMKAMKSLGIALVRKYKFFTHYKTIADVGVKTNLVVRPEDGHKVYIEARD